MTAAEIEMLFTRSDGTYGFARWGRPIAPIVFGVEDKSLPVIKGAFDAVVALADHKMAKTDPEIGINCMVFFFREWSELLYVPNMSRILPNLKLLVGQLEGKAANQYRVFRFDNAGGIKAAFVFLRMDQHLADVPAEILALSQVVQTILLWSDVAFGDRSPLAVVPGGATILRPEIATLIRAAYLPSMPVVASDPSHALRLYARLVPPQ